VAAETAQEAQDVVFGMFLVSSAPTSVLFDFGALHTFISAEYVAKYSIPLGTMPSSMLVNSPGGNMRAAYQCLGEKTNYGKGILCKSKSLAVQWY
jgi:hypothetical protein